MTYKGPIYPVNEIQFDKVINQIETIDFAEIASGAQEVVQKTVTGAALGDFVIVTADADQLDLVLSGYVSAANTVEVVASNLTGSAVNLASGTFNIKVLGVK